MPIVNSESLMVNWRLTIAKIGKIAIKQIKMNKQVRKMIKQAGKRIADTLTLSCKKPSTLNFEQSGGWWLEAGSGQLN